LAIARLFLQKPDIIILDEPTSALDSFSEDSISKALENLSK
jgi:ABC-type multidrug transport system fused ATPase/permease subunit